MTEHLEVAGLEFLVESRDIGEDGGPTIRVYGMAQGERVQLLRFDCFRKAPHYHYDPEHDLIIPCGITEGGEARVGLLRHGPFARKPWWRSSS